MRSILYIYYISMNPSFPKLMYIHLEHHLKPALSIPLVAAEATRPRVNTAPATLLAAASHLDAPGRLVSSARLTTVGGSTLSILRDGEGGGGGLCVRCAAGCGAWADNGGGEGGRRNGCAWHGRNDGVGGGSDRCLGLGERGGGAGLDEAGAREEG
jgi:hypothetical protein